MHQPVGPPFSDTLVRRLREADRVAVLTGAGISAESGVPTFRDPDGLWQRFRPEELANVEAFLANPTLVQGWYAHRRALVEDVEPNAGHRALAALERWVTARGGDFLLATQNVDGLHARAGSERLVELHGSLLRSHCIDCAAEADESADARGPLTCQACGGLVRPDVVWFGEQLPEAAFAQAEQAAALADVYLSVGTSAVVYPAAGLPLLARQAGAYVAEVNPTPSDIAGRVSEQVRGTAGEVLPALVAALGGASGIRGQESGGNDG
ncbi:SIR2 family NAD-dependent protein deacylase [Rubrivirga sp.]|uniref:SIR2 family NAD-dependent protein deacylase n=1 Tax=Rubrivirga sp. TaxID=1885344 RepID=UPI003B5190F1